MRSHRRAALTVAAVAGLAAALPGSASAAVVPAFDGTTLTVTSDDAGDGITITRSGADLLVNNAPVAGSAGAAIVVNAGGGADNVNVGALAADDYASLVADGGAGDDVIAGGADVDQLRGGDDDDRIVPGRGNDDAEGGAGNDLMIWNNGDGTDVMDGDAGADEVEVNGSPNQGDQFTIRPGAVAGRVQFDRVNLGTFGIDLTAERLSVNGLGGDDEITGSAGIGALLLTLSGGPGADQLRGADGNDLLLGGDDADVLEGGAGDDRLVGDRGGDAMRGGDGDDTMVWNNGDGSDTMDGDGGLDRVEVNGAPAGDVFTLAANGARVRFDRTNLGPFTLDTTAEALQVNGLGGDDALTVGAGVAPLQAVTADGGPGNDALTGNGGAETFFGGAGDDTLNGGGASDLLDGQSGNDTLNARDNAVDLVRGGDGTDTATADRGDAVDGIEALDLPAVVAPPAADVRSLAARIRTATVRVRRGAVRLSIACPAGEANGCRAAVTLVGTVTIGGERVSAVIGTARTTLRAGQRRTLTVRLAKAARKARRISARATVISTDGAGNVATSARRIAIRVR